MTRVALFALASLLLAGVRGRAAEVLDPEAAFWRSATRSHNPAEIQAYLDAYPNGRYRELAKIALELLAGPSTASPAPARSPGLPGPQGRVRPSHSVVELVDGVAVDVEASALHASSNLCLVVVPAGAPDAVADRQRFAEESTPITASRLRLTVPAGPPGADEVRLYHIPPFGSSYQVAARAAVTVRPGVDGAVLPLDLSREAARLGPARFEALHRDRPMLIQAAFLGLTPRTDWNLQWFGSQAGAIPEQVVVVRLGLPNAAPDYFGSIGEAVCLLDVADRDLLDRLTTLQGGDPVLVRGTPTTWSNSGPADAIVLNRCSVAP